MPQEGEAGYDFLCSNVGSIVSAYSIVYPEKRAAELASFSGLDDDYKKIVITMDDSPFTLLENGYRKLHVLDFLLGPDNLDKA